MNLINISERERESVCKCVYERERERERDVDKEKCFGGASCCCCCVEYRKGVNENGTYRMQNISKRTCIELMPDLYMGVYVCVSVYTWVGGCEYLDVERQRKVQFNERYLGLET